MTERPDPMHASATTEWQTVIEHLGTLRTNAGIQAVLTGSGPADLRERAAACLWGAPAGLNPTPAQARVHAQAGGLWPDLEVRMPALDTVGMLAHGAALALLEMGRLRTLACTYELRAGPRYLVAYPRSTPPELLTGKGTALSVDTPVYVAALGGSLPAWRWVAHVLARTPAALAGVPFNVACRHTGGGAEWQA